MRGLIVSAVLWTALAGTMRVQAQTVQSPTSAPRTMSGSPFAGIAFSEQPFPLRDDGTYSEFLAKVAKDIGCRCGKLKSYAWDFKGQENRRRG